MANGRVVEGVLAVNKPTGISSAQVLRDLQKHFFSSKLFAPWLEAESARRARENNNQKRRRRDRRQPQVKIGHGGTLDPLATGVLIAGIGSGTKSLGSFLTCTKTYEATVLLGVATDSYDRVGRVLARAPYAHVTRERVEEALAGFRGKIMQRPPLFSALRVQGKRLYEYAREGKEVPEEIRERPVEVLELEILEWHDGGTHGHRWPKEEAETEEKEVAAKVLDFGPDASVSLKRPRPASTPDCVSEVNPSKKARRSPSNPEPTMSGGLGPSSPPSPSLATPPPASSLPPCPAPALRLRVTSTSGFYVRSLCHDLGAALGSLAIMAELVRTRQGPFDLRAQNVLEYAELARGEDVWGARVQSLLDEWRRGQVEEERNEGGESGERKDGDGSGELDAVGDGAGEAPFPASPPAGAKADQSAETASRAADAEADVVADADADAEADAEAARREENAPTAVSPAAKATEAANSGDLPGASVA
ncbi:MAG: hypothetical protein M1832_003441 [Thelocarpon impressellum]|nr:MAG: hypothetical protein M1832_003441 [Thelocarpon impressellum]